MRAWNSSRSGQKPAGQGEPLGSLPGPPTEWVELTEGTWENIISFLPPPDIGSLAAVSHSLKVVASQVRNRCSGSDHSAALEMKHGSCILQFVQALATHFCSIVHHAADVCRKRCGLACFDAISRLRRRIALAYRYSSIPCAASHSLCVAAAHCLQLLFSHLPCSLPFQVQR